MLCRDSKFWDYLYDKGEIFNCSESHSVNWLCSYLNIVSRAELKTNEKAQSLFEQLNEDYKQWKN
jgi:hypothetical protein